jgi:hypothetical protein
VLKADQKGIQRTDLGPRRRSSSGSFPDPGHATAGHIQLLQWFRASRRSPRPLSTARLSLLILTVRVHFFQALERESTWIPPRSSVTGSFDVATHATWPAARHVAKADRQDSRDPGPDAWPGHDGWAFCASPQPFLTWLIPDCSIFAGRQRRIGVVSNLLPPVTTTRTQILNDFSFKSSKYPRFTVRIFHSSWLVLFTAASPAGILPCTCPTRRHESRELPLWR